MLELELGEEALTALIEAIKPVSSAEEIVNLTKENVQAIKVGI